MRLPSLRRIRRGWERVRPFPLPRYAASVPKIGADQPLDLFVPPNTLTLAEAAMSKEAANFVADLMGMLTPSDQVVEQHAFYRLAQAQFGRYWRCADLTTALWAAATLIRPSSYLEIGVRRGRSAAVVAATCPKCAIYGFDLWVADYAGAANPGPDFVRSELRAVGHQGGVVLMSGDSRNTVPAFLRTQPDLYFDLITVDGDHSLLGAATDLANTLPRLKVGGVVVFDDISAVPALRRVWEKVVKRDSRYAAWEFTDAGYGTAVAIRISDEPTLGTMQ